MTNRGCVSGCSWNRIPKKRGIFYECEKAYERKVFRKNVVILKYQCGVMKHHRILDKDHHSLMATKMCGMVTEKEKWNEKARKGHRTLRCILIEKYQFSIADGQGKQADTL